MYCYLSATWDLDPFRRVPRSFLAGSTGSTVPEEPYGKFEVQTPIK